MGPGGTHAKRDAAAAIREMSSFKLVSALMGRQRMQAAYAHAIDGGYRFYSYGDISPLLP